jgi:hypothetical protein
VWYLEGPVIRVTIKGGLIPFSPPLEEYVVPGKDDVIAAVHRALEP